MKRSRFLLFLGTFFCGTLLFAQGLWSQIQLPPNMYADTLHAPFLYGLASGEPTETQVIIWTKVDPEGNSNPISLSWKVTTDYALQNVVASGNVSATAATDWTAQVDVSGLSAGQTYWYHFREPGGQGSRIGRTKTAKSGSPAQVRMAVASCSSIYSGYFNAYRRIAERDDIDLMVHLGDYVYDFVDQDEQVRVPVPAPVDPSNLSEWRELHAYYLLDPDLRLARQMHPWVVIWDNHDVDHDNAQQLAEAAQAFQEYIPMRLLDAAQPTQIWRKFSYGDLLDLYMIDVNLNSDIDMVGNELSMMGDSQWTWLSSELQSSTSKWRVIANEKMVGQFATAGVSAIIPFGDGPVADSGAWDGYNADRVRLLSLLDSNNQDNNVFLSGDIHMSFANDLPIDYGNYDAGTGAGSIAVEFLPTSITRGNFDEAGISGFLVNLVKAAIDLANPHHVFSELVSHGYGILDVRPSGATAEFWYSDILSLTNAESFETGYICRDGDNHWDRNAVSNPTVSARQPLVRDTGGIVLSAVFPNPSGDKASVTLQVSEKQILSISVFEAGTGRKLVYGFSKVFGKGSRYQLDIPTGQFASGNYVLVVRGDRGLVSRRFTKL